VTIGQKIPSKPTVFTEEELKIKKELLKFKDSYIFINTNFRRKSQPIFALAFCEGQRNIALDKNNLIFKSDKEVFQIISDTIKNHYISTNGKIGIWGNVVNYAYHHNDGKVYVFDKYGNQIDSKPIVESRASLRLK